jgi:8-oxo-dGTP diphosphatase
MTILQRNATIKNPIPAVDFLIPNNDNSKILLVRRKNAPFKGMLSVPGGFINEGETAEDAMRREAKKETSLFLEPIAILGVYSDPHRDPRKHTLSVTFIMKTSKGNEAAGDDAAYLQWISVEEELDGLIKTGQFAFDHSKILSDYKNWIKAPTISPINSRPTFWSTKKRESSQEALRNKASDYG